ncbi:MAG: hypothetical protein ABWX68_08305 [Arthrobacter sp.]
MAPKNMPEPDDFNEIAANGNDHSGPTEFTAEPEPEIDRHAELVDRLAAAGRYHRTRREPEPRNPARHSWRR